MATNWLELLKWRNYRKCPYGGKCRTKFDDGIVKVNADNGQITGWHPSGAFLFHYQDTHGFPHEMIIEELEKLINSEMTESQLAYYNSVMRLSHGD